MRIFRNIYKVAETPVITTKALKQERNSTNMVVANHVFAKYITVPITVEV